MVDQRSDIVVELVKLGDGNVRPSGQFEIASEDLLSPERRIVGPATPNAQNLQLIDGIARTRPGYAPIGGTKPDSDPVTGGFTAVFDDGTVRVIRTTATAVHQHASATYTDITPSTPPAGTDNDYWDFAMAPVTGGGSPGNQLILANGVATDNLWLWDGAAAAAVLIAGSPLGAKTISVLDGTLYAGNTVDGSGDRHTLRIERSTVNDPTDWTTTNLGAGTVDLRDSKYPIARIAVLGGAQVILCGDESGGVIYRGTPTGQIFDPIAPEALNPGVGVGLLLRRSFLLLTPMLAFFVAHDGFYLWDGGSGLERVAELLAKHILRRLNYNALDAAFATYNTRTTEVTIYIPTSSSTVANEAWVWNRREDRVYGPYEFAHNPTVGFLQAESGTLTWDTLDYRTGWDSIPFSTWDTISGEKGGQSNVIGTDEGDLMSFGDQSLLDDDGTAISWIYDTPNVAANGRKRVDGRRGVYGPADLIALADVLIRYRLTEGASPTIAATTDGGSMYVTLSSAALPTAGAALRTAGFDASGFTELAGAERFALRISGTGFAELHSIFMRAHHAGDVRV